MQETFQSLALMFGKRKSHLPPIVCKQARTSIGQINRQRDGLLKLRKPVGKWVTWVGKHLTLDVSCVSVLKPLTTMVTMMVMVKVMMVMVMRSRNLLDAFLSFPRSQFISELR